MDALKKWLPLNFSLLGNPVNWVIVVLMVAIAGMAMAIIFNRGKISTDGN